MNHEQLVAYLHSITSDDRDHSTAEAAWKTDQVWRSTHEQQPDAIPKLLTVLQSLDLSHIAILNLPGSMKLGKQQPSFVESITETAMRLQCIATWRPLLPSSISAMISGGSMSYGRFFNVRGGYPNSSDLDIILVATDELHPCDATQIVPTTLGVNEEDQALYARRLEHFIEYRHQRQVQVLSHKFSLPALSFDISTHLMSIETFSRMFFTDLQHDLASSHPQERFVHDYKPAPFKHRVLQQRTFTGEAVPFPITESGSRDGGVITDIISYATRAHQIIPGMYHNLVSPLFEVELDRNGEVATIVRAFKTLMQEQAHEAKRRAKSAELAKSHIRFELLSPFIRHFINHQT